MNFKKITLSSCEVELIFKALNYFIARFVVVYVEINLMK